MASTLIPVDETLTKTLCWSEEVRDELKMNYKESWLEIQWIGKIRRYGAVDITEKMKEERVWWWEDEIRKDKTRVWQRYYEMKKWEGVEWKSLQKKRKWWKRQRNVSISINLAVLPARWM